MWWLHYRFGVDFVVFSSRVSDYLWINLISNPKFVSTSVNSNGWIWFLILNLFAWWWISMVESDFWSLVCSDVGEYQWLNLIYSPIFVSTSVNINGWIWFLILNLFRRRWIAMVESDFWSYVCSDVGEYQRLNLISNPKFVSTSVNINGWIYFLILSLFRRRWISLVKSTF